VRPTALLAVLALAACAAEPERPTLDVRARFVEAKYDGQAATVEHEAIPGRMPAMRMDLSVADPALLDGLAPGAPVVLRLDSARFQIVGVEPLPPGTVLDLEPDEVSAFPTDSIP
jgi:Cu/Ag efflux protein CusF